MLDDQSIDPSGRYAHFHQADPQVLSIALYEAWDRHCATQPGPARDSVDMGEDFDFDDPKEMRRRLPRLAALYLPPGTA